MALTKTNIISDQPMIPVAFIKRLLIKQKINHFFQQAHIIAALLYTLIVLAELSGGY